jgi:16S rRNA (guanine527-N7)-methyltransferase
LEFRIIAIVIKNQFLHDLSSGAAAMGVQLSEETCERLFLYYYELQRWNHRMNLVSRREPDWLRVHFLDSLAPLSLGLMSRAERMVDLGAGAGFPGVPLKVAGFGVFLGMAEASGKKCAWLRHLVRTLGLKGAEVLQGRFGKLLEEGWAGSFDLAVSRAAAKPSKILSHAKPFLVPNGRVLVYTTAALVEDGVGRAHPYRIQGSKVPSVIWEVARNEM